MVETIRLHIVRTSMVWYEVEDYDVKINNWQYIKVWYEP